MTQTTSFCRLVLERAGSIIGECSGLLNRRLVGFESPPAQLIIQMKYSNPSEYDKHISTKQDKTLGYIYFIDKEHPLSSKGGKVYYHRHVVSVMEGRWIDDSYHVHHIDENRSNNDPSNLQKKSPRMHRRDHGLIHGNVAKKVKVCPCCKKKFISIEGREFCSLSCSSSYSQFGLKQKISKNELEHLVWTLPTTTIAKKIGCSDVAIAKLCKKWKISKPPRGYWAKQKSILCQKARRSSLPILQQEAESWTTTWS